MRTRKIVSCLLIITATLLMGFTRENPTPSPKKIMNAYRGEKGFFSFSIPAFIAKIFISGEDDDIKDAIRDIRKIRLLVCENAGTNSGTIKKCKDDFARFFRESGYVDIMLVNDDDETVVIKAVPHLNCLHDPIVIADSEHEFAVIHLLGSVDMEKIQSFIAEREIN